jgi:hypothetical protein
MICFLNLVTAWLYSPLQSLTSFEINYHIFFILQLPLRFLTYTIFRGETGSLTLNPNPEHYCFDLRLKSNQHPLSYSATFSFSPPQEIITSFRCAIQFHSPGSENAFLLRFFMFLP